MMALIGGLVLMAIGLAAFAACLSRRDIKRHYVYEHQTCPVCQHPMSYSAEHDALYCHQCGEWVGDLLAREVGR